MSVKIKWQREGEGEGGEGEVVSITHMCSDIVLLYIHACTCT